MSSRPPCSQPKHVLTVTLKHTQRWLLNLHSESYDRSQIRKLLWVPFFIKLVIHRQYEQVSIWKGDSEILEALSIWMLPINCSGPVLSPRDQLACGPACHSVDISTRPSLRLQICGRKLACDSLNRRIFFSMWFRREQTIIYYNKGGLVKTWSTREYVIIRPESVARRCDPMKAAIRRAIA